MDTVKPMPTLMGAAHSAADGQRRILAQLEHGPKAMSRANRASRPGPAWRFDGWAAGLVLLLLTMAATAWLMHEETITPVTFKRYTGGSRAVEQKTAEIAAVAPVATAAKELTPATIVNEPRRHIAASHNGPAAPTRQAPATPQHAAGRAGKAAHRPADHAQHANWPGATRDQPAQATTTKQSGSAPMPSAATDTDITLLTAMVAHAGKRASAAPERSRDVVERTDGVPTTELLARCKQLGLMEGMLCRSRICSGSWESDPACRAPAQ